MGDASCFGMIEKDFGNGYNNTCMSNNQHFSALYPVGTRVGELNRLLSFIKTGGVSEVVSMQGVGRTIFLGLLAYNRKIREEYLGSAAKSYHFVLVDFAELKRAKEEEVWKTLFSTLLSSLEERGMVEEYKRVKFLFSDAVSYQDSTLLFQGFKSVLDFLLLDKGRTVIFLFDTFELYAPSLSVSFFERLRVLQDRYRYSISLVFSSSHPLEQLVGLDLVDTVSQFISEHTLYLSLYDEVGYAFLVDYLQKHFDKKLPPGVVKQVHELTGGHAKLSKVFLEELLAHDVKKEEIADFAYSNKSISGVNREIWMDLFPREQLFLRSLLQSKRVVARGTEEEGSLRRLFVLTDELTFTIPLFEAFVRLQSSTPLEHSFDLNLTTGEVLKGDIVISDMLTKQEYKLLRYFLEHASSILSRDDLASAAWGIDRVEEGISDQAIDQLVFRLRRKIEDDPNKPHHIQTVKGRGFVFKIGHE